MKVCGWRMPVFVSKVHFRCKATVTANKNGKKYPNMSMFSKRVISSFCVKINFLQLHDIARRRVANGEGLMYKYTE
jgi:hypothetical protein